MLIYNKSINYAKQYYITPLSEYGVPFSRLRQEAVKFILTKGNPIRVDLSKASEAVFHFQKDELLKAINNDAMLFFIRTMLQGEAAKKSPETASTNWCLVTDYYYGFYLSGLLLRLCLRGTVYFDDKSKNEVNAVVFAHTNSKDVLGSNCYFVASINDSACEYTLTLTSSTKLKTHELVWAQVASLLSSLQKVCDKRSDEYTVLAMIAEINKNLGSAFPSKLRNKVNYHPYYAVREVNKEYCRMGNRVDWLYPIQTYDRRYEDRDQTNINLVASYIQYLQQLTFCLLQEYDDQRGRAAGILSAINKSRTDKITLPSAAYNYR